MPELDNDQITLALAVVAGVALLSGLLVLLLAARLRKARREYMSLRGDGEERDILSAVGRAIRRIQALEERAQELGAAHTAHASLSRSSLQKFAIIRYNAFEDMGGQLSFSAAILDDHGDGVVVTSINGRTETRTYAKPIQNLNSQHNLSDEERDAIAAAASGAGRGESLPASSRSR